MGDDSQSYFRFGLFEVDVCARVLRRDGVKLRIQEQPFQVLLALLEMPGEIVTREQLRQRLWPEGTFVEFDRGLNTAVKKIRKVLCDDAAVPRYVETIPRRGYRFLAEVESGKITTIPAAPDHGTEFSSHRGRMWTAAVACLVFSILLLAYSVMRFRHAQNSHVIVLAVLPFNEIRNGSIDNSIVADVTRATEEQLERVHPPHMVIRIPKLSEHAAMRHDADTEQLKIDYVVQGGVVEDQGGVHVAVQLVAISEETPVWSEKFDRGANDPTAASGLAVSIVRSMQPTLSLLAQGSR